MRVGMLLNLGFLLFTLIFQPQISSADGFSQYQKSLDRTCQSDSDCAIMPIQTCCGGEPACLNKNAPLPDANIIINACAEQGMTSVCGYPDISSCSCVNNTCAPNASPHAPVTE